MAMPRTMQGLVFSTDIRDRGVEPPDEAIDPLIVLLEVGECAIRPIGISSARAAGRVDLGPSSFPGHGATSPRQSASLSTSYLQTRQANVCRSKSLPRVGCGVRRVRRMRFLHCGQTGLSVAPKRTCMVQSLGVGSSQLAARANVPELNGHRGHRDRCVSRFTGTFWAGRVEHPGAGRKNYSSP